MADMDIVWLAKPGPNEQLRHSIRSLTQHLEYRGIHIIGHPPSWFNGRVIKPWRTRTDRHANTTASVKVACLDDEISDTFILANDDFFTFELAREAPMFHGGSLAAAVDRLDAGKTKSKWSDGARATLRELRSRGIQHPVNWDLHTPLVVHKEAMLEAIDIALSMTAAAPWKRTIYGNLALTGGTPTDDVKIHTATDAGTGPWLSTGPASWPGAAGDRVRAAFTEPSGYELHQRTK